MQEFSFISDYKDLSFINYKNSPIIISSNTVSPFFCFFLSSGTIYKYIHLIVSI